MRLNVIGSSSIGNCYLLEDSNGEKLMIECGMTYSDIKKGSHYDLSNLSGVLVSHSHKDHSKAAFNLAQSGHKIYMSEGCRNNTLEKETYWFYAVNIIKSEETYQVGSFSVMPFGVVHDAEETLNFLIHHNETGTICFITDTAHVPYRFENISTWMIEANYSSSMLQEMIDSGRIKYNEVSRVTKNHMSLEMATEVVRVHGTDKLKNVVIIHMSDRNSYEDYFKQYFSERTGIMPYLAGKGMEIKL